MPALTEKTRGGKLLTTFVLHVAGAPETTEGVEKQLPAAGEGAFLFYLQQNEAPEPLDSQLGSLQAIFRDRKRKSAIDRIFLQPTNIEKETLCYFENSKGDKFEDGDNALFSCDHVFIEANAASSEEGAPTPLGNAISWDSFLESPLLIFDDRYSGPGFWNFVEELIRQRTSFFLDQSLKVQLQGLAVPVAEESIDAGYTYDVFYSETNRSSSDADREARNATKYTVRNIESLSDVLTKSEAYTTSIEKDVGRSHLVLHVRFSGEGKEKQNICIVRLRSLEGQPDVRHFLLSAEVLRLLVEELALASAEGEDALDSIVFQENGIKEAFDSTRLTHIISKVIRKSYASCQEQDKPLFHWLVNLPAGDLLNLTGSGEKMVCVKLPVSETLTEAVGVAVRLQDVNIARSEITESGKFCIRKGKQRGAIEEEEDNNDKVDDCMDDSILSLRRRKLKVKRLYDTLNNRSKEVSRSTSEIQQENTLSGTGEHQTSEVREELQESKSVEHIENNEKEEFSVPRGTSVSTAGSLAGSYAESWNTVDLGGSAARRRYRLKRKPRRKVVTPVFSDAPGEESGQIALVEGDFDSTSLRGSSAVRTRSNSAFLHLIKEVEHAQQTNTCCEHFSEQLLSGQEVNELSCASSRCICGGIAMNLFLSVAPIQKRGEGYDADDNNLTWKPNLFDSGPWTSCPSRKGSVADEEDVCTGVWDRSNITANMRNGRGFLLFSYGPSQSGKTCRLLGGRMARLAKFKDDCAPKTTIIGPRSSSSTTVLEPESSNSSVVVHLEPTPSTIEELRRQYLALLGEADEEDYGEHSILLVFLRELYKIRGKGCFHASAVEYFYDEWYDLFSHEVCNISTPQMPTWKPFETEEECISLLAKAQNRRLEPSQPKLTSSVSHLVIQIRFSPNTPSVHTASTAYFIDLAGCGTDSSETDDTLEDVRIVVQRTLMDFRTELLGKHMKSRVTLLDRCSHNDVNDSIEKQKKDRWRTFISTITSQRDPSSVIGIFTLPPSNGGEATEKTLDFSRQLWKQTLCLPALRNLTPCRNEKERQLKRVYGGTSKASSSVYRGSAVSRQSSSNGPHLADNTPAVLAARRPAPPTQRLANSYSGRRRSHRSLSLIDQTDPKECMRAALECMSSQRKERRSELTFLQLKEENCRLAVTGMERQAREVLWLRWELFHNSTFRASMRSCILCLYVFFECKYACLCPFILVVFHIHIGTTSMAFRLLVEKLQLYPQKKYETLDLFYALGIDDLGSFMIFPANGVSRRKVFSIKSALAQNLFCSGPITAAVLFENTEISLSLFVLPPNSVLPFHDHPSMEVHQRILFGAPRITEMELCPLPGFSDLRGRVIFDGIVLPTSQLIEQPSKFVPKRNLIHEIVNVEAQDPVIFIDLISPPYYQPPKYLSCTYYTCSKGKIQQGQTTSSVSLSSRCRSYCYLTPRTNFSPPMNNLIPFNLGDNLPFAMFSRMKILWRRPMGVVFATNNRHLGVDYSLQETEEPEIRIEVFLMQVRKGLLIVPKDSPVSFRLPFSYCHLSMSLTSQWYFFSIMRRSCLLRRFSAAQDVVVSGGGLVGSAMMAALQQLRQRLQSKEGHLCEKLEHLTMIDAGKSPCYDPSNQMHQLRTCSITPVSSKILENLQCWDKLTTKHAYYRVSVRHECANSPHIFSTSKTESDSLLEFVDLNNPVGFICFNTEMQTSMVSVVNDEASRTGKDQIVFESNIEDIKLPTENEFDGNLGVATMGDETINFRLLLGCEGRGSNLREIISSPSVQHDYSQTAYVCTVKLAKPYDGNVSSFQNFFSDGKIIAMLPTSDDTANIVFTTTPGHAKQLIQFSQEELVDELNRRLHSFAPSDIPKVLEVPQQDNKRAQGFFPLRLTVATKPYSARAICLGDAAHGIHPFAGQGLNLGIYDICALTDVLEQAITTGHDIGNCVAVGQKFAGEMLAHSLPIIGGMEAIKFMCHNAPSVATLGMKVLNRLPFISPVVKDAILYSASGATFANRHKNFFLLGK
eukprot:gene10848-7514_t